MPNDGGRISVILDNIESFFHRMWSSGSDQTLVDFTEPDLYQLSLYWKKLPKRRREIENEINQRVFAINDIHILVDCWNKIDISVVRMAVESKLGRLLDRHINHTSQVKVIVEYWSLILPIKRFSFSLTVPKLLECRKCIPLSNYKLQDEIDKCLTKAFSGIDGSEVGLPDWFYDVIDHRLDLPDGVEKDFIKATERVYTFLKKKATEQNDESG